MGDGGASQVIEIGILGIFVALLWVGWELHRVAHYIAGCSVALGSVQTEIIDVNDEITIAGRDVVDAINSQAAEIKQDILAVENKLPD
jgi:hypothetical protein